MTSPNQFFTYLKRLLKRITFTNSKHYWKNRYNQGGNSGSGSYGHLAEFKASILNEFIIKNKIQEVIEFGCGDGNQITYLQISNYLGFDISEKAIKICKNLFNGDESKKFKLIDEYQNEQSDLVISLDVIFHLIEDQVYENYMDRLFSSAKKYVIIYSSNTDVNLPIQSPHFKHRQFSRWVEENFPSFDLLTKIPNKYSFDGTENTSVSDFYIYTKKSLLK
jgi:SAM-dependent methyltransferase